MHSRNAARVSPGNRRRNPWFLGGAALVAALAGAALLATGIRPGESGRPREPGPAPPEPPPLAAAVVTLRPGVHLLGLTSPNASYAVETTGGLILVDTCQEDDAGPILRQLALLGLDVRDLKLILLTHAHADHSLGAERLRQLSGAKVFAGKGDAGVLRAGGPPEALFSVFDMAREAHPTTVDVEVEDGQEIRLGEVGIRCLATPGHTPGSVCYLMEKGGLRILFTGDTLMSLTDTFPLTGPGIYAASLAPRYRGNAAAFQASLERLLDLPVPDLVLPGHPRSDPEPQSPRVPAWWWREILTRGIARLKAARERLSADGPDFLDGRPKTLLEGLYYLGDREGSAVYAVEAGPGDLYLVNAPGAGDPAAFVRQGLAKLGLASAGVRGVLLTTSAPEGMAGLRGVVEEFRCVVYAPPGAADRVAAACPPGTRVLPAEDLVHLPRTPIRYQAVDGMDSPEAAYLLEREGKRVLLTGGLPDPVTVEPEGEDLRWSGRAVKDLPAARQSTDLLARIEPDLWLPLRPLGCQNANLYGSDWERTIRHNRDCLEGLPAPVR